VENNILHKKTEGLTIVELSISLILSGIIIGLAIMTYQSFGQHSLLKAKQNDLSICTIQNLHVLKDKIYFSSKLIKSDNNTLLIENKDKTVIPLFVNENDLIIGSDTLSFPKLSTYFIENDIGLVQTIEIEFNLGKQRIYTKVIKDYDNEILFNNKFETYGYTRY
jgi:type II secretory pathway pseudopilin PulG